MSEILKKLIYNISKLPTVGRKNAEKIAFFLLESDGDYCKNLIKSIIDSKKSISLCLICNNYTEKDICNVCSDDKRDEKSICIVKNQKEILSIERSKAYLGMYHVLNLKSSDEFNPQKINIDLLLNRIKEGKVEEIIIAFDPDLEGDTLILYLEDILKNYNLKVSKIARGIPMGGKIEQSDLETVYQSIKNRFEGD